MDLTTLPDEVKELVRAQLEAGRFQSAGEIVEILVASFGETSKSFA